MGDSGPSRSMVVQTTSTSKRSPKSSLVTSSAKIISPKTFNGMFFPRNANFEGSSIAPVVFFLLKVASLEMLRRFSRARCPFAWRGLQALHLLCYPPFKWLQRWAPLKLLIGGMQKLSRPLLFLSIATAFTDDLEFCEKNDDNADESQPSTELPPESTPDTRIITEEPEDPVPENWMLQLLKELEDQGVTLPERIDEDELRRFYTAANGDFSCLLSSIKKTIRWRETYAILSAQELETWSHLVFWHGYDVKSRPCLIIRLGLACSTLTYSKRPHFVQAIVSQMEYGVLHLVNAEDPRVTVLMDCEGVSSFRFPMQMMRSCSALMQDHFPTRLAVLFLLKLSPVVRVIAQTLIQVLRPSTRSKVRFEGETYIKVLTEYLETVPACLGGNCTCDKCQMLPLGCRHPQSPVMEAITRELSFSSTDDDAVREQYANELPMDGGCEQIIRTAIVGILMVWIFIGLLSTMFNEDGHFLPRLEK